MNRTSILLSAIILITVVKTAHAKSPVLAQFPPLPVFETTDGESRELNAFHEETRKEVRAKLSSLDLKAPQYTPDRAEKAGLDTALRLTSNLEFAEAARVYSELKHSYYHSPRVRSEYARFLISQNKIQEAGQVVQTALQGSPTDLRLKIIRDAIESAKENERIAGTYILSDISHRTGILRLSRY